MPETQPLLIVEDSRTDFLLLTRILEQLEIVYPIYHVVNGNEALDFLYRRGTYQELSQSPFPIAILLDLNMPGMGGKECLRIIKQDQTLKIIPTIILSSSEDPQDVNYCYQYGANSYMHKTTVLSDYRRTLEVFANWLDVCLLPNF
ncbi:MAG TPA: response regulator [Xenococcaceae cyanobacterium]